MENKQQLNGTSILISGIISLVIILSGVNYIFGLNWFKSNPYVGEWYGNGCLMTINENGTGTLSDSVTDVQFTYKWRHDVLVISIPGEPDTYCDSMNDTKDCCYWAGILMKKK